MELYEREFLLSKILFGSTVITTNDLVLYINPLTVKQNLSAQQVFKKSYEEALFSGVFTRKEMLQLMMEQEVWSEEQETLLDKNKRSIEDLKLKLYENFLRPSARENIRHEVRDAEKRQIRLFETKHQNDHLDCEGIATYARLNWVIENTTTHEDGTPCDFYEISVTKVLKLKAEQDKLEVDQFREIARTEPWRSIWVNSDRNPLKAFQANVFELTPQQDQLASWSRLYDNIGEAHEPPPDNIVQDDDAIDGWLVKQQREREREQNKFKLDGFDEKHPNADEVFIVAQSKEEVAEINNLNDPITKMIMENRLDQVEKSKKPVDYHKFKDVQVRAMNEANSKLG